MMTTKQSTRGAISRPAAGTGALAEPAPAPRIPARTVRDFARRQTEWGMATAEYAIATLAAVGFAGLLVVILRSEEVRGLLMQIIRNALGQ